MNKSDLQHTISEVDACTGNGGCILRASSVVWENLRAEHPEWFRIINGVFYIDNSKCFVMDGEKIYELKGE